MTTFFDCYCGLGALSAPAFGQEFSTADALQAALAEAGIAEALVYSPVAYEYDPAIGNQFLMEAIAGHENLHPCWVLLPPATGELPSPDELLALMAAQKVRAARLAPGASRNNFSLADWSIGPLLAALAAARVPIFIDQEEIAWPDVASILHRYPNLPLVLTGVTYRLDRYLYPLWERHANLHVEISGYQGLHSIAATVRRFGPERLLFGTHMPRFTPGAAIAAVTYAGVSDTERALIAHGNLRRLLEAAHDH